MQFNSIDCVKIWSPDQNDPIKTLIQAQSEVRCIDWLTQENGANKPLFVVGYEIRFIKNYVGYFQIDFDVKGLRWRFDNRLELERQRE